MPPGLYAYRNSPTCNESPMRIRDIFGALVLIAFVFIVVFDGVAQFHRDMTDPDATRFGLDARESWELQQYLNNAQ